MGHHCLSGMLTFLPLLQLHESHPTDASDERNRRKQRRDVWKGKSAVIDQVNELIDELDDIANNIALQVPLSCAPGRAASNHHKLRLLPACLYTSAWHAAGTCRSLWRCLPWNFAWCSAVLSRPARGPCCSLVARGQGVRASMLCRPQSTSTPMRSSSLQATPRQSFYFS